MRYFLDEKSGFTCFDKEVIVFKDNSELFYSKKNANYPNPFRFNLPRGVYVCFNEIYKNIKPHEYELEKLPPKEKNTPKKKPIIKWAKNPNKASIDVSRHLIIIDHEFKKHPDVNQCFLIAHELGHYYYYTEWKCDLYAKHLLLKMGFNLSQISEAIASTLNCNIKQSKKRISNIHNFNKKNKLL